MKITGASMTRTLAVAPPILNRMRKISACLRKLSLNAANNCVQNRRANRRVSIKDDDMSDPLWAGLSYRLRPHLPFMNFGLCGLGGRARAHAVEENWGADKCRYLHVDRLADQSAHWNAVVLPGFSHLP